MYYFRIKVFNNHHLRSFIILISLELIGHVSHCISHNPSPVPCVLPFLSFLGIIMQVELLEFLSTEMSPFWSMKQTLGSLVWPWGPWKLCLCQFVMDRRSGSACINLGIAPACWCFCRKSKSGCPAVLRGEPCLTWLPLCPVTRHSTSAWFTHSLSNQYLLKICKLNRNCSAAW